MLGISRNVVRYQIVGEIAGDFVTYQLYFYFLEITITLCVKTITTKVLELFQKSTSVSIPSYVLVHTLYADF